jgi:hypothetical protein
VDYPKDNTFPFERKLQEKHDLDFVECLALFKLEARTSSKKRQHDGAKKKGKGKVSILNQRILEFHSIMTIGKERTHCHLNHLWMCK